MKKTIGIVTWVGGGTYGTSLQSYALNRKLALSGYRTCQIVRIDIRHQPCLIRNLKTLLLSCGMWPWMQRISLCRQSPLRKKLFKFEKESYRFRRIYSKHSLEKAVREMDVFCSGSDQIWNTAYRFDEFMFLDFAQDKKRISYASSIGTNNFPEQHKNKVASLLDKFSHIGVRETSATKVLRDLLPAKDIVQVSDPTFLLDRSDWQDMARTAEIEIPLPQTYMLCYFVGEREEYIRQLRDVIMKTGIKDIIAVTFQEKEIPLKEVATYHNAGPREFVYLIEHAEWVCTDSFHATALSINFGKNFVDFRRFDDTATDSQNSRIYDLLSHYGLMQRLYDAQSTEWSSRINYSDVNKVLEEDRKFSTQYLLKAIEE